MLKSFLIILLFLVSSLSNAQNVWQRLASPVSYPNVLSKVVFKDSLTGWASGDSGFVIHTTDGGAHWEFQNTGINTKIWDLFFLDKMHGWAISWYSLDTTYGSYLLSTSNGGITWNRDSLTFKGQYLYNVFFRDSLKGFVSGNNSPIYLTTNGGVTWAKPVIDTFSTYPGGGFSFYDDKFGFAYGGIIDVIGILWKTTDGGLHWNGMDSGSWDPLRRLHFYDSLHLFGIGGDAEYGMIRFLSTNGGDTWTLENLSKLAIPQNLSFRTDSEVWIPLGFVIPEFFVTKDSGNTWNSYPVPNDLYVYDISFPDSLHGFAVGLDGLILKYNPEPSSVSDITNVDLSFELHQNYPNPFNSRTEISYTLKKESLVELSVFDILGKKIKVLFYGHLQKGNHKTIFDASMLSSGIYYYKLTVDNAAYVKKAVLLK